MLLFKRIDHSPQGQLRGKCAELEENGVAGVEPSHALLGVGKERHTQKEKGTVCGSIIRLSSCDLQFCSIRKWKAMGGVQGGDVLLYTKKEH